MHEIQKKQNFQLYQISPWSMNNKQNLIYKKLTVRDYQRRNITQKQDYLTNLYHQQTRKSYNDTKMTMKLLNTKIKAKKSNQLPLIAINNSKISKSNNRFDKIQPKSQDQHQIKIRDKFTYNLIQQQQSQKQQFKQDYQQNQSQSQQTQYLTLQSSQHNSKFCTKYEKQILNCSHHHRKLTSLQRIKTEPTANFQTVKHMVNKNKDDQYQFNIARCRKLLQLEVTQKYQEKYQNLYKLDTNTDKNDDEFNPVLIQIYNKDKNVCSSSKYVKNQLNNKSKQNHKPTSSLFLKKNYLIKNHMNINSINNSQLSQKVKQMKSLSFVLPKIQICTIDKKLM